MLTLKEVNELFLSEPVDMNEAGERYLVLLNQMIRYTALSCVVRATSKEHAQELAIEMLDEVGKQISEAVHVVIDESTFDYED